MLKKSDATHPTDILFLHAIWQRYCFLCHTNSLLNFVLEISKRISFAGLFFTLSWHMDRPQVGQFGNITFTNLLFADATVIIPFSGIISGFTNVKELYQKIAECYDMPATDVSLDS